MSIHIGKGKTAKQCITERLDYIMNPEKTDGGMLVSSFACAPPTAADEFLLYRSEYQTNTGRSSANEVIAYHIRQAFKPGEITPEEANAVGRELAGRITENRHAYVVATHIDKQHVHNHIIFCSTDLECRHKFRDAKRSGKDIAQISDEICRKHELSIIQNPREKSLTHDKWQGNQRKTTHRDTLRMMIDAVLRLEPDGFDALMQMLKDAGCLIRRGSRVSIRPPGGERFIRLDSLGPEYDEQSLCRVLAGDHVHIPRIPRSDYTRDQVKQLIDLEKRLLAGKGKGYEVWAQRHNLDAKAQSVIFLKENNIGSMDELEKRIQTLLAEKSRMNASIREKRNRMKEINEQRRAIRDYSRTKEIYTQYRESGWSSEFYADHREEIEKHKKAQAVYTRCGGNLPALKELTADYSDLRNQVSGEKASLDKLKQEITNLKHVRHNCNLIMRDTAPERRKQQRTYHEDR